MSTNPTERAQWAWETIAAVYNKRSPTVEARYGTLARKLPALLHSAGLGQTMAFLFSKSKPERGESETGDALLLHHLAARLRTVLNLTLRDDMDLVVKLKPAQYRRATEELRAAAQWLKRFAEGRLAEEK